MFKPQEHVFKQFKCPRPQCVKLSREYLILLLSATVGMAGVNTDLYAMPIHPQNHMNQECTHIAVPYVVNGDLYFAM